MSYGFANTLLYVLIKEQYFYFMTNSKFEELWVQYISQKAFIWPNNWTISVSPGTKLSQKFDVIEN